MKNIYATLLLVAAAFSALPASAEENPQQADLPHVLIIGDSISIGYTPHVAELLAGKALVKHHKGNAGHTAFGLKRIDLWLGDTKWDVIHFNFGLHDLCYRHPEAKVHGNRDKVNGSLPHSIKRYEENLDKLVTRLKETGATLIWASTTLVPEGEAGRKVGDDKKYNDVAAKVMTKHGIATNDLYTLTKGFAADLFSKPGDVHYTKDGYKKIARQVAAAIETALQGEQ